MGFDPVLPIENGMQVALIVVPVAFAVLATVAVGLRVLARRVSHRQFDASDYVIVAALVVTIAFSGLIAAEPFTGAGMHLEDVVGTYGAAPLTTYTKMTIANQILWAVAVCLPKVSILMLYTRVFTMRFFITAARVTGVLILLLGLATVLGALLQCQPFAYNWDQTIPGGHCGDQILSFKITGAFNVTLDILVLLLPMPYLCTLEMALYRKIILILTFAGGFVTCIFSALRIHAITSMSYSDLTYDAVVPSIYSVLEPTMSITLACIPVMRPLLGGRYSSTGTRVGPSGNTTGNSAGIISNGSRSAKRTSKLGFTALGEDNDDSSDYQLRPLEPTRPDAAGTSVRIQSHRAGGRDRDSSFRSGATDEQVLQGAISVKQGWEVRVS
ncbi:hypothetical protein KVR01_011329 [Diaporthe batatas]|uniref:uncharacterized protein n=1 Tax=Diaporthe batatas TaxID=748121 RepID=UPI001D0420C2|nr:uncharacterized protein KVR01_011329 [Diaporthe batatas]KAG8158886.1 hypothetical protein KVR01_011329 [Diaporthe batatas]